MTVKIRNCSSGIFHYHAAHHVRNFFAMVKRVLQIFQEILPLDELDRIFDILKKIRDLVAKNTIALTLKIADAMRTLQNFILVLLHVLEESECLHHFLCALNEELRECNRAVLHVSVPLYCH